VRTTDGRANDNFPTEFRLSLGIFLGAFSTGGKKEAQMQRSVVALRNRGRSCGGPQVLPSPLPLPSMARSCVLAALATVASAQFDANTARCQASLL